MATQNIVKELREWRKAHGLTLEAAGALIVIDGNPVNRATFHAWETGRKVPKAQWMRESWRVTGVEPNAFYRHPVPALAEAVRRPAAERPRQESVI